MALSFWEASLAIAFKKKTPSSASLLMLGRQTSLLTPVLLEFFSAAHHQDFSGLEMESQPWAEAFFQRLGYTDVKSLDFSDYEGAEHIHDMNRPWPQGLPPRQFDVVFDGGTLEHVFNLPQALLNAMSLVKPGGSFLGVSPSDGWLGHGFHQLQPELFFRFFNAERGFRIRGLWLAEFGQEPSASRLFRIHDPAVTGCRTMVPGRRPLVLLVVADKIAETDAAHLPWPGQSNYTAMWQGGETHVTEAKPGPVKRARKALLKCIPDFLLNPVRQRLLKKKHERMTRAGWDAVSSLEC